MPKFLRLFPLDSHPGDPSPDQDPGPDALDTLGASGVAAGAPRMADASVASGVVLSAAGIASLATPAAAVSGGASPGLVAPPGAMALAAASPPTGGDEVTFIAGVDASLTVAGVSFGSWNYAGNTSPATYSGTGSWTTKQGSPTPGTGGGTVLYYFDPAAHWTATEQAGLASGLALWSAEANISFALTANAAQAGLTFARVVDTGFTFQAFPFQLASTVGAATEGAPGAQAYIQIDTNAAGSDQLGGAFAHGGGRSYATILAQEGHFLGLGNAGTHIYAPNPGTDQFSVYDTRLWTLMSGIEPGDATARYFAASPVTGTSWLGNSPTTPMIIDILAAQRLYGAATSGPLAAGGVHFGFHANIAGAIAGYFDFTQNTAPVVTLWAGGSNNTLDLSGFAQAANVDLHPGTFSSAAGMANNLAIAEGVVIDHFIGGSGSDTIRAGAGAESIDGGAGHDSLQFGFGFRGVGSVRNGDASVDVTTSLGTNHIQNVELITFVDGRLVVDLADPVAQVFRLYQAALARAPDEGGLAAWSDALIHGTTLKNVTNGFIGSIEFAVRFPSAAGADDGAFVEQLYQNVLHRASDPAGKAGWVNALTSHALDRADVLDGFSESAENINNTAPDIHAGTWVPNIGASEIARLYDTTLARRPDVGGLAGWVHALDGAVLTLNQITDGFTGSVEFQAIYGALDDTHFVTALYINALHRAPETAGLNAWLNALNAGAARSDVVLGFSESAEHIANTLDSIQSQAPANYGILFL